jgi:hypothetical protein
MAVEVDKIYKSLKIIEIVRDYPNLMSIHAFFMRQLDDASKECAAELKKILDEEARAKAEAEAKAKAKAEAAKAEAEAKAKAAANHPPEKSPPEFERRV